MLYYDVVNCVIRVDAAMDGRATSTPTPGPLLSCTISHPAASHHITRHQTNPHRRAQDQLALQLILYYIMIYNIYYIIFI